MGNPSTITIEGALLINGLKHNLHNIIQLWEKGYSIFFDTLSYLIEHKVSKSLVIKGFRVDNIYFLNLDDVSMYGTKCLITKNEDYWLWHRCLGHVHFDLINKISSKNIVVGLPKIKFPKDRLYDVMILSHYVILRAKIDEIGRIISKTEETWDLEKN